MILLFFLLGHSLALGAANLLENGGFEQGQARWKSQGGTFSIVTSPLHEGQKAGALLSADLKVKWLYQAVTATPGATYTFSGWVLRQDPGIGEALLRLTWLDGGGVVLRQTDSPQATDSSAWQYLSLENAAPSGAVRVWVAGVFMPATAGQATVYFDDMALTTVPGPPTPTVTPVPTTPPPTPTPLITLTPTPTATPLDASTPTPAPSITPAPVLLSVPTSTPSPVGTRIDIATSGIVQQLLTIWSFEAATRTWLVYDPLAPARANTLSYLTDGQAYWIAVTVDTTLTFEARTRTIYRGWNLIGW